MARAEAIRAFARRDWARVTAAKRAQWASMSPSERFRIAQSLWVQACAQLPGWPDAASRAEDLADHLELTPSPISPPRSGGTASPGTSSARRR